MFIQGVEMLFKPNEINITILCNMTQYFGGYYTYKYLERHNASIFRA